MRMKKILTISAFALLGGLTAAQDIRVHAAFDSSRIYIGDQIHFTVTVEKPEGTGILFPALKDSLASHVEILKEPVTDSVKIANGRTRITRKYLVTSFDSGFYQVPPQYTELQTANGVRRFYSDYTQLTVNRVKIVPQDTTAKIFDIVKPYRAPITAGEILPWLLLAIVLAAIAWYAYRFIRRLRAKRSGEPETMPNTDPAHVIALRALEQLKEEKLWQQGQVKLYYTRLTEIVRQYLENRYGIQSLELTTLETLNLLKKTGFKEDELYSRLRTLLTGADLIKFAKYNPVAEENELYYDHAWDFISLTRLVEEDLPAEPGVKEGGPVA